MSEDASLTGGDSANTRETSVSAKPGKNQLTESEDKCKLESQCS